MAGKEDTWQLALVALVALADARRAMAPSDHTAWAALHSRLEVVVDELAEAAELSTDLCDALAGLLQTALSLATTWQSGQHDPENDTPRELLRRAAKLELRVRETARALAADGHRQSELEQAAAKLRSGLDAEQDAAVARVSEIAIERRGEIGNIIEDLLPLMVRQLRSGTVDEREQATIVVWALVLSQRNLSALTKADVIKPLVVLIETGTDAQKQFATWTLRALVTAFEANKVTIPFTDGLVVFASLEQAPVLAPLVKIVREGSESQVRRSLWALSTIAESRDDADETVADVDVLELVLDILAHTMANDQKQSVLPLLRTLAMQVKPVNAVVSARTHKTLLALLAKSDPQTRIIAMKVLRRFVSDEKIVIELDIGATVTRVLETARNGTTAERTEALKVLVALTEEQANRVVMLEKGTLTILAGILQTPSDTDKVLALSTVRRIASYDTAVDVVTKSDLIKLLIDFFHRGSTPCQEIVASTLERLVHYQPARAKILSHAGLAPLVRLMRSQNSQLQLSSARVIRVIADEEPSQHVEIARVGGVEGCVALSRKGTDTQKMAAVATLLRLSSHVDIKLEIARVDPSAVTHAGVVMTLVEMLKADSDHSIKVLTAEALGQAATEATMDDVMVASVIEPLVDLACGDHGHIQVALRTLCRVTLISSDFRVADDKAIGPCVGRLWNDELTPQSIRADKTGLKVSQRVLRSLATLLHGDLPELVDAVTSVLVNLSLHDDNKAKIARGSSLPPLMTLIQSGTTHQTRLALSVLCNLATGDSTTKSAMVEAGLIGVVMGVLGSDHQETDHQETNVLAVVTLWNLADDREVIKRAIASAGAIPILVELIQDGSRREKEVAAGALWSLARASRNTVAIADAGAIAPLVALVRDGTDPQKHHAAGALCALAARSDAMKQAIEDADGVVPLAALARGGSSAQRHLATWALERSNSRAQETTMRRNTGLAIATVAVAGVAWALTKQG